MKLKSLLFKSSKLVRFGIFQSLVVSLLFISANAFASGGIRGTVKEDNGSPLSFATIFVKQTGTGTTTNINGYYEILLPPGNYDVVYQYLGYESQARQVTIDNNFIDLDIVLKIQVTLLREVTVKAGEEDPAYTIMRKAISKAKYHTQQLDGYSAKVYIKGAGQLKDYPWLAKKALEKEGIEKNVVYTSEQVSEIKYTRPKKFEEKVISIRSDGKDNNTSPTGYIFGSFYEPEIAETISPLSPKAFSYYRFEYQGTFKDRDYEVSRIKVTPRSKGDNVVEGMLYIVEDWWSIHSLDIRTTKLGLKISIKGVYAPIEDKAWLPVSHQFKIDGKVFGFEFEYKYLATVSDYKIQLNPDLYVDKMEVIDEKIEKEHAKEIQQKFAQQNTKAKKSEDQTKKLQERLASGEEITRKELKTIVKEYEKQERKELKEPEVVFDTNFKIDSGAYKKDSAYWANIRPVPLTKEEIIGYRKFDSVALIARKKEAGDTLKESKSKGFQPWDILLGDNYKISEHSNFKIHTPLGGFNTVEGFNIIYKLSYGIILQDTNKTRFVISPVFRYSFEREKLTGFMNFTLRNKIYRLRLEGGQYIKQYNKDEPIHHLVNTFTTLFLERNLMKIYERKYIDLSYRRKLNPFITAATSWSWAQRSELVNNTYYKWVDRKGVDDYTPNQPKNAELTDTSFPTHEAFIGTFNLTARPWLKYRIRNGQKYEIRNSSPIFSLDYTKGFNYVLGSDIDYDQIEVGVKHELKIGVRGNLDFDLRGGMFLNSDKMYFMDYKHFLGNKTPFSTTDPVGSYRLLDYYLYSTADKYFSANLHYHFRRFLLTSFPFVRLAGIRENLFLNYLATPTSHNYTEVGYSVDGILRIFRLEAAASFYNGQYKNNGFRIGIATNIMVNFADN
jgi:hypothetical protein